MIRIESSHLISFFRSEADKAAATGFPVLAEQNQITADTFRDFAGKLHFYPHATPDVYFYSPLPALPAVSVSTYVETVTAFEACSCESFEHLTYCAHWANYIAMGMAMHPVDRDGLTAID